RRVLLRHHLDLERPRGEVASPDGVVEVLLQKGWVLSAGYLRFRARQAADALVGLEVELDPEALAGRVDPLERMRTEAVHVPVGSGDAAIAEQPGELVRGLRRVGEEVPDVVGLLAIGEGIVLLRV